MAPHCRFSNPAAPSAADALHLAQHACAASRAHRISARDSTWGEMRVHLVRGRGDMCVRFVRRGGGGTDAHTARHDAAAGRAPVAAAPAAPGCGSASGSERRRLRAIAAAEPSPGSNLNPAAPAPAPATVPSPSPSPSRRERKTWLSCDASDARRSPPAAPCAPGVGAEEVRPKTPASSSGLPLRPGAPRSSDSRAWRGSGAGSDRRSRGWEGRRVAAVPEASHEDFRRAW